MQSVLNMESDENDPATRGKVIETVQLFPSDHSIITVVGGDVSPSITIYFQSYTIGLRESTTISNPNLNRATAKPDERCCLACEADDDVRFVVGISGEGTPFVTCTTADGQQLRFSLDGTVTMSFQTLDPTEQLLCPAVQREVERRIATKYVQLQAFTHMATRPHGVCIRAVTTVVKSRNFSVMEVSAASSRQGSWCHICLHRRGK